MESPPRILLVDDNKPLVDEIQSKLRYEGFEIATAKDGTEGLQQIISFQPYVVVLDIDMPVMDGRDMLRQLRLRDKITRVIVLTNYREHKARALKDQANLFVDKPYDLDELISYLKNFAEDYLLMHKISNEQMTDRTMQRRSQSGVMIYGLLSYDPRSKRIRLGGDELDLTPTEKRLLYFFMQNPDQLFSVDQLFEEVLGYTYEGNSNNIRANVSRLRSKLGDDAKHPTYIEAVREEGYRFIAQKQKL